MKLFRCILFLHIVAVNTSLYAQPAFDSVKFFLEEKMLDVTLTTDIGSMLSKKIKDDYQKATFACKLPDGSILSEDIRISIRGHMRRTICNIPPVRLSFRNTGSPKLSSLNTLKLVNTCRVRAADEQLLLKEFLIYKMYNLLTEKSFRVRLLKIAFDDSKGKKRSFSQYGFLVENVDAMAKRNQCKELNNVKTNPASINREQMTMLAIFEYMIGNTDWSVPNNHNIKLLMPKKDKTAKPYVVPYDFDFAGFVNADYAAPDPIMGIETVVERLYRGFPRTMDELQVVLKIYNQQKENIYALIKNFEPLNNHNKKEIIYYLDDFYKTINQPAEVQFRFIDNARFQ